MALSQSDLEWLLDEGEDLIRSAKNVSTAQRYDFDSGLHKFGNDGADILSKMRARRAARNKERGVSRFKDGMRDFLDKREAREGLVGYGSQEDQENLRRNRAALSREEKIAEASGNGGILEQGAGLLNWAGRGLDYLGAATRSGAKELADVDGVAGAVIDAATFGGTRGLQQLDQLEGATGDDSASWEDFKDQLNRRDGFGTLFMDYEDDATDGVLESAAQGLGAFVGDVALDPLTYLTLGASVLGRRGAGQAAEAAAKGIAPKVMDDIGQAGQRKLVDALDPAMARKMLADGADDELSQLFGRSFGDDLLNETAAKGGMDEVLDAVDVLRPGFKDAKLRELGTKGLQARVGSQTVRHGARGIRRTLLDTLDDTKRADELFRELPAAVRGGAGFRAPFGSSAAQYGRRLPIEKRWGGGGKFMDRTPGLRSAANGLDEGRARTRAWASGPLSKIRGELGGVEETALKAILKDEDTAAQGWSLWQHARESRNATASVINRMEQADQAALQISRAALREADDPKRARQGAGEFLQNRAQPDVVAETLHAQGMSPRDIAAALDVSEQWATRLDEYGTKAARLVNESMFGAEGRRMDPNAKLLDDYFPVWLTGDEQAARELRGQVGSSSAGKGAKSGAGGRLTHRSGDFAEYEQNGQGGFDVSRWLTAHERNELVGADMFDEDAFAGVGRYLQTMNRFIAEHQTVSDLRKNGLLQRGTDEPLLRVGQDTMKGTLSRAGRANEGARQSLVASMRELQETGDASALQGALEGVGVRQTDEAFRRAGFRRTGDGVYEGPAVEWEQGDMSVTDRVRVRTVGTGRDRRFKLELPESVAQGDVPDGALFSDAVRARVARAGELQAQRVERARGRLDEAQAKLSEVEQSFLDGGEAAVAKRLEVEQRKVAAAAKRLQVAEREVTRVEREVAGDRVLSSADDIGDVEWQEIAQRAAGGDQEAADFLQDVAARQDAPAREAATSAAVDYRDKGSIRQALAAEKTPALDEWDDAAAKQPEINSEALESARAQVPEPPIELEQVDAATFHRVAKEAGEVELADGRKVKETVEVKQAHEYEGAKTFLTPDRKAGYALMPDGDAVSLFSVGQGGRGAPMMQHAVKQGAKTLDAFDEGGRLPELYRRFGWVEHGRVKWNPEYAPEGWTGADPDVVLMHLQPEALRNAARAMPAADRTDELPAKLASLLDEAPDTLADVAARRQTMLLEEDATKEVRAAFKAAGWGVKRDADVGVYDFSPPTDTAARKKANDATEAKVVSELGDPLEYTLPGTRQAVDEAVTETTRPATLVEFLDTAATAGGMHDAVRAGAFAKELPQFGPPKAGGTGRAIRSRKQVDQATAKAQAAERQLAEQQAKLDGLQRQADEIVDTPDEFATREAAEAAGLAATKELVTQRQHAIMAREQRKALAQLAEDDTLLRRALEPEALPPDAEGQREYIESLVSTVARALPDTPRNDVRRSMTEWRKRSGEYKEWLVANGYKPADKPRAGQSRYAQLTAPVGREQIMAKLQHEGLFAHPDVGENIARMFPRTAAGNAEMSKFVDGVWAPTYGLFKSLATVGRGPGYVARNVMGGAWNAWLLGVQPSNFATSGRMMRDAYAARGEVLDGLTGSESAGEVAQAIESGVHARLTKRFGEERGESLFEAYKAFHELDLGGATRTTDALAVSTSSGTRGVARGVKASKRDMREAERPMMDMVGAGPRRLSGAVEDADRNVAQKAADWGVNNTWMRGMTTGAANSEEMLRLGTFLKGLDDYGIEDGGVAASLIVKGSQFDYADLSDFERRVMKNWIPFYTFTRNNVPLQFRALMSDPGKMNRLNRGQANMQEAFEDPDADDHILPPWVQERMGFVSRWNPQGTGPLVSMVETPATDLNRMFNTGGGRNPVGYVNWEEAANMSNPGAKLIAEFLTGTDSFTGGPIRDEDTLLGVSTDGRAAHAVRGLIPTVGQLERTAIGPATGDRYRDRFLTTLGSQLAATPGMTLTPDQESGTAYGQSRELRKKLKKLLGDEDYDKYRELTR